MKEEASTLTGKMDLRKQSWHDQQLKAANSLLPGKKRWNTEMMQLDPLNSFTNDEKIVVFNKDFPKYDTTLLEIISTVVWQDLGSFQKRRERTLFNNKADRTRRRTRVHWVSVNHLVKQNKRVLQTWGVEWVVHETCYRKYVPECRDPERNLHDRLDTWNQNTDQPSRFNRRSCRRHGKCL